MTAVVLNSTPIKTIRQTVLISTKQTKHSHDYAGFLLNLNRVLLRTEKSLFSLVGVIQTFLLG